MKKQFSIHSKKHKNVSAPSKSVSYSFFNLCFGLNKVELQLTTILILLMYKKQKLTIKLPKGASFPNLIKSLYEQIAYFEINHQKKSISQCQKQLNNILGFTSLDGNINFDYKLTLEKGSVQQTKFFQIFTNHNTNQKYKIYNCLAIGGFSKVYLGRSYQNGKFYALKFIKKARVKNIQDQQDKLNAIKNQIKICRQVHHPFISHLHHAFETNKFYCLVSQYYTGGQLFFLLKKIKLMSQKDAKFYFLQILMALSYLHTKNIIYRDLKPQNVLIDYQGNIRIVDFGLSKQIQGKKKTYSYCGSAQYMAPEMILRMGHSFGVDYYSLGALLYELVTGLPPFYTSNHQKLEQMIVSKDLSFPSHIQMSSDFKDLLNKLLHKQEKRRLGSFAGIKQILCHPWVGKVDINIILNKQLTPPYLPNPQTHNFDQSELGSDEQQFSQFVRIEMNDISRSNIKQYYYFKEDKINQKYIQPIIKNIPILRISQKSQHLSKINKDLQINTYLKSLERINSNSQFRSAIFPKKQKDQSFIQNRNILNKSNGKVIKKLSKLKNTNLITKSKENLFPPQEYKDKKLSPYLKPLLGKIKPKTYDCQNKSIKKSPRLKKVNLNGVFLIENKIIEESIQSDQINKQI